MRPARLFCAASLTTMLLAGTAAYGQAVPATPAPNIDDSGDKFRIGIGAVYKPSYEGSDNYSLGPAAVISGRVSGFSFWSRGTSLYFDVIPESGKALDFSVGPVVGIRKNRTGGIKDNRVRRLGKLNTAYEVGGFVGVAKTGVITSEYDTLGFRLSYVKDVGNAYEGHIITPSIDYGTPLSTKTYVGIGVSADFVSDGYASYYFNVSPAGSLASGLPAFSADGGFKSWGVNALVGHAISGDLQKGWLVALTGSYNRLRSDFRRSPITSIAGSPNQWMVALGIGYAF